MVKIGLLSDTHSYFDNKMVEFFENVDQIWHCGDIGSLSVLDKLKQHKPVIAVYGNIDNTDIRSECKPNELFTVDGINVYMTHIGGYPGHYQKDIGQIIKNNSIKLFVCGHSHILKVMYDKKLDCLHINPGAAGVSGFHAVRTMVRFNINNKKINDLEIYEAKR